jgi:hypothetical protein
VVLTPDELKKSSAGRKPFDAILMFRMLVLQARAQQSVGRAGGISGARPAVVLALSGAASAEGHIRILLGDGTKAVWWSETSTKSAGARIITGKLDAGTLEAY